MLKAFLFVIMISADPKTDAASLVDQFKTVEECIAAADKLNRGSIGKPGAISEGHLFFCARVVYPT
jgi:hypothetical protein